MASIDEAEFKRVASSLQKQRPRKTGLLSGFALKPPKSSRTAGNLLESYFSKSGLNIEKLNKLSAKGQKESLGGLAKERSRGAKNSTAAEAAFRQGMESRREAQQRLSAPFAPILVPLDRPFLIWELPHPELDAFIDSHYESMNSWVKINIAKNSGSDSTTFVFYFFWSNDTDFFAVLNASSTLMLNGFCEVVADTGFLSGHSNSLYLLGTLSPIRWSGWGTDPLSGDQTPYQTYQATSSQYLSGLVANGGGLFGDVGIAYQEFDFTPFDFSLDLLIVPPRASLVFEVNLLVQYSIEDGDEFDHVILDFANDKFGRRIICPAVELALLTPI